MTTKQTNNLARLGHVAKEEVQRRAWAKHQAGSAGAANEGRSLTGWTCACGWSGTMRDLKVVGSQPTCPSCGEAGSLKSA
jgi:hypothetical protein